MTTRMTFFEKTHLIRFQIIRKNTFDPSIAIIFSNWLKNASVINIGVQDHNRRFKLIFELGLSKGVPVSFSPTRLIIFLLHADWLER